MDKLSKTMINKITSDYNQTEAINFTLKLNKYMKTIFDCLGGEFEESIYINSMCNDLISNKFSVLKDMSASVIYDFTEVGPLKVSIMVNQLYLVEVKKIEDSKEKDKEIRKMKKMLEIFKKDNNYRSINSAYIINVRLDRYEIITVQ